MRLIQIAYRDYRNIEEALLVPDPGITLLCGDNGQGKTNLLEGIYFFASGRSFRTVHDAELIRNGCRYAELSLLCESLSGQLSMTVLWDNVTQKRFFKRGGVPLTLLSEMIGSFRAVLFCPQHLSLVCDGPGARRSFLDVALSQSDAGYLASLRRYNRILSQRNALIRLCREKHDSKPFADTAPLWSEQLAKEAAYLAEKRVRYVERLNGCASAFVRDMTGGTENASFSYRTPRTEEEYFRLLTENAETELRAGSTLYGIHKDDVTILLSDKEARSFASRGQQRSLALAMKLAEGELSKEDTGEYPVFLFDDVLSELDEKRRVFLLSGIRDKQVIMTSCEAGQDPSVAGKCCRILGGRIL